MEDITITAQQLCDTAKAALENGPSFSQTFLKTACDKACEGLDPCELPAAGPAPDAVESGFEQIMPSILFILLCIFFQKLLK